MREIKFRAVNKLNNTLVEVTRIDFANSIIYYNNPNMENTMYHSQEGNIDDFILLQYTGYQDEEWTEIFEGNIVDFMDYSFDGESEYNCRGEVIFEDGAWHITNAISTSELFNYEGGAIKVIGNIFENPELLEQ